MIYKSFNKNLQDAINILQKNNEFVEAKKATLKYNNNIKSTGKQKWLINNYNFLRFNKKNLYFKRKIYKTKVF